MLNLVSSVRRNRSHYPGIANLIDSKARESLVRNMPESEAIFCNCHHSLRSFETKYGLRERTQTVRDTIVFLILTSATNSNLCIRTLD